MPWKSVCRVGEYLFVRISLLHKPCRPGTGWLLFYSSPNTSWQRCRLFFFKGTDENFLVHKTKENPDTVTTSLNKAGKGVRLNKMYFKICINNSWLPCKVVSVPLVGQGACSQAQRNGAHMLLWPRMYLPWPAPAAPWCDCCRVRRVAQSRRASLLFPEGCKGVWEWTRILDHGFFSVDSGHPTAIPQQYVMAQVQLKAPWKSWCSLSVPEE